MHGVRTSTSEAAGLVVDDGILIDAHARTSDPDIVAAGDCTSQDIPRYGRRIRLESVPSAVEQAKVAAATICGNDKEVAALPWFWSDQYDLKLQIAGYAFDADNVILRGDPATAKFAIFHLKGDQVQSVEAINSPPEFMMGKLLILNRKPVDKARLADPTISMKEVAA